MKIERQNAPPVIIGKRVTVGAAINSLAAVAAHIWPEHAPAVVAAAVPVTFITQIIVVNKFGVTSA
jgi:hypothetical protein